MPATAVDLRLHDSVTLAIKKDGYAPGTRGVIVDAYPETDRYTVELVDDDGETVDLVDVLSREITLRKRPS